MFVVHKLVRSMEAQFIGQSIDMPLQTEDGMIGMLPVFDTRAEAEAYADGADILEIRLATPPAERSEP